ncbi:CU044_5270 family protein [Nonomuraea sp. NPDC049028]|uniref:CU044_5270 family protein n=1 Tax=Nonomuraea sp. NPDC049028 TaxID=3364348 RepID=UPI003719F4D2
MKEFQVIDDVMPDVPPADPARTMGIRAQLMGRPPRRRLPGWSRVTLAAAAVTLVLVGGFVVVPRLGGGEVQTAATSNVPPVLAAAADRLAAQPPGTGAWWRRETLQVERIRTKANPSFTVEQRVTQVLWVNREGEDQLEQGDVTSTLLTPADEQAWKDAGSPPLCVPKGKCAVATLFWPSADPESLKPVTRLPIDAEALKAELLTRRSAGDGQTEAWWLWATAKWLLFETQSTPGTRAALYRMLAGLPGVQVTDKVSDVEGRAGVALLFEHPDGYQQQIIIDRGSGDLLAAQTVLLRPNGEDGRPDGRPLESWVIKKQGWTDETPKG